MGIKTKKQALRKLGKPYLMLLRAIILRLGKQKLVVAIKENYYAISFKTLENQQVTFPKITVKLHSQLLWVSFWVSKNRKREPAVQCNNFLFFLFYFVVMSPSGNTSSAGLSERLPSSLTQYQPPSTLTSSFEDISPFSSLRWYSLSLY